MPSRFRLTPRWRAVLSLAVLIPLGLAVRFVPLPFVGPWLNDLLGSVVYVVFWCVVAVAIWPRRQGVWQIPLGVLGFTCLIEVLQLWQAPWLVALRATVPGRLILGNTFVWLDFAHYAVGAIAGWLWLRWLWQRGREHHLR
ncbi:MAG: DUF2809 domain-containing protein [Spirulinaceae cyanobacterium]